MAINKQSKAAKLSWADPEVRAKRLARMAEANADPDVMAKRLATFRTKEFKDKLSVARKKMWEDPEYRAKRHASQVAAYQDPEKRKILSEHRKREWADGTRSKDLQAAKASIGVKKSWTDPDIRAKHLAGIQGVGKRNWSNPEYRAKQEEACNNRPVGYELPAMKVKWADPEYHDRMTKKRQTQFTPEVRAKMSLSAKQRAKPVWNKGLTKETDPRLAKTSERMQGRVPDYKKQRVWYHGPMGHYWMRAKWEVAYGQYLDRQGIRWAYEDMYFYVGDGDWTGRTYVPDFHLLDEHRYVEIKGRLSKQSGNKLAEFKRRYPTVPHEILYCKNLKAVGVLDIYGRAILEPNTNLNATESR